MKHFFILFLVAFLQFAGTLTAQNKGQAYKSEAQSHMNAGRYGEAIDQLNKYISQNPQLPDGYTLRGECFEKRGQIENAVIDFKRASKLAPNNKVYQQNLSRVQNVMAQDQYKKIEGHRRELAINANAAVNYLEIGKCYKKLDRWPDAEQWYDEYLKRATASSDEVIRYTEILAETNHLAKGEKILKQYTDKYPNDQRLWSRYGYFTMWLGKYKIAITAFEKALELKPFFKEAMDGLDQAKGKAYIYTYRDTTERFKKPPVVQEYPIDKHFRMLKKNPKDSETRFTLVDELYKAERLEEAYQQIQILSKDQSETERFKNLNDKIVAQRDSIYQRKIREYSARVDKNPGDKEAALRLAEFYGYQANYDLSSETLRKYLEASKSKDNDDVRFRYARYLAWNYKYDDAMAQADTLLQKNPDNTDYKLFKGQVLVWTAQNPEMAQSLLDEVLKKNPESFDCTISLATLAAQRNDLQKSRELIDKAKEMDPNRKELETVENYYNATIEHIKEMKLLEILYDAQKLVEAQDCQGALVKYDEYMSQVESPSKTTQIEYADVNICAKNTKKAVEIYDKILLEGYDYDIALHRAKAILWSKDSLEAVTEFEKLHAESPDNFGAWIGLGEAYHAVHQYDKAKDVYDSLLAKTTDSSEIALVKLRMGWLPGPGAGVIGGLFSSFPNYVGFAPQAAYYSDNFNLVYRNFGGRLDLGLNSFMSVGVSFSRGNIKNELVIRNFTVFKGHLFIKPFEKMLLSGGYGTLTYQGVNNRRVYEAMAKYEKEKEYSVTASYDHNDAGLIIYSPRLVDERIIADYYRINGTYDTKSNIKISATYSYIKLSDNNEGNDLQLRLGKQFIPEFIAGYEYVYSNYKYSKKIIGTYLYYYYSPQNFESHSLWAEWDLIKENSIKATLSGKVGYVPSSDFLLREIAGAVSYNPFPALTIVGKIAVGGSYKYNSTYKYVSGTLAAYWGIL